MIGAALRSGARDFLITGTVDTALPDLIDDAVAGHRVDLTVVDRCPMPLALVERFASRRNLTLACATGDILAWETPRRFDLVLTHSLFGSFAPDERPRLMAQWFALLKPGGTVATVVRLRPQGETTRFDRAATAGLADEAARRYAALGLPAGPTVDDFRAAVDRHLGDRRTHPVRGLDEVAALFAGAGLEIVALTAVRAAKRAGAVAGPAQPTGATYCHAVARRP